MVEVNRCPKCNVELASDSPRGLCAACLLREGIGDAATLPPQPASVVDDSPPEDWYGAPAPEKLAQQFPHLEIIELLGQGGMGAVYKVRQPRLNRLVALKILPPKYSRDRNFADRFVREAQALAKLNHPNIVTVYDFGETSGLFYFLMEYVDGVNLRQSISAGSLTPQAALAIVPQVCDALQYAHDEGVVHRDIKPENVLLDSKGRVKIADFGLAKLFGAGPEERRLTVSYQAMGTMHYMAPEQMENPVAVDHRADIYSLGVVLYELLTGELPLGRFELPSEKAQVNSELDEVVLRTLAKEPGKRYQHVSEVKTAVERISDAPASFPTQARPPVRTPVDPSAGLAMTSAVPTVPHYGQIAMGAVMMLQGLTFFLLSAFSIANALFWVGFGLLLGGGGVLSAAWKEGKRLPRGAKPDPSGLIMGGMLVLVGAALLVFTILSHGAHPFPPLIWVGMGLVLGGGGCFSGAWSESELPQPGSSPEKSDAIQNMEPGTVPHYGRIALGIVMALLGLTFCISGGFSGLNLLFWVGLGFVLGGGRYLSSGWKEEWRLPRPARPDPSGIIMAGVMLVVGLALLGFSFFRPLGAVWPLLWVGAGLVLAAGSRLSTSWQRGESEIMQPHVAVTDVPSKQPTSFQEPKPAELDRIRSRLRPAAISLIAVGVLSLWPTVPLLVAYRFPVLVEGGVNDQDVAILIAVSAVGVFFACFFSIAGINMLRTKHYGLVFTSAIVALLPCYPSICIGIPIGIWVLLVLANKNVKAAFT